jgi:diaminohydroxyphosphoribosylaminopyrimidine deaminase/5-amino-6-(5-phosphoribosylamino)uracil reductase
MKSDTYYMQKALILALKGSGSVSPNPRVGCVIVKNDTIIGEGWHERYGEGHAEVQAIQNATADVAGATVFINLEPCSHFGKTPPCTDLLIEKKVKRVVIGMVDPNPLVAGKGIEALHAAGIEVTTGILEEECRWVNRMFMYHITTGMPYVVGKIAQSLDGCIATKNGTSRWISGEESRRRVHMLRAELDAVLVGKNTAHKDDPELTVRDVRGIHPWRVVLDSKLSLPFHIKLFSDRLRHKTIVICTNNYAKNKKADNLRQAGVHVVGVAENSEHRPDMVAALKALSTNFGISSVMVEGGGILLSSFAHAGLLQEVHFFIAPLIIGGGIHPFSNLSVSDLQNAQKFTTKAVAKSGNDTHVIVVKNQENI